MKHKNRRDAKRKYKQTLLATTTAFTLGLTGLGTTGILQKPTAAHAANADHYNSDNIWNNTFSSRGDIVTVVEDVKVNPSKFESLDTAELNNTLDHEQTLSTQVKSFKVTDSVTAANSTEFTFGYKASLGLEIPGIAKASGEWNTGFKFTNTNTRLNSTEKTLTYGGDKITVPAHKKYKVEYQYVNTTFTGKYQNMQEIKGKSTIQKVGYWSSTLGYNTLMGAGLHNSEQDGDISEKFGQRGGETMYDLLKAIDYAYKWSAPYKYVWLGWDNNENYYLTREQVKQDILDWVRFDDINKKVYLLKDSIGFSGNNAGSDMKIVVTDITNNMSKKVLEAPVSAK